MTLFYRKDDRGFSLVELIVVILIMGVLSGGAIGAVSAIYHANAERAAKKIVTLMEMARTEAMATDTDTTYVKLKIYQQDGENYAGIYRCTSSSETLIEPKSPQKLSNYRVSVLVGEKNSTDADRILLDGDDAAANSIEYRFKKSSGGIKSVKLGSAAEITLEEDLLVDIIVQGASTHKIIVVPATGRCYIND